MTAFMTEDFLLDTEFARRLYHDYAKDQPIFDYHCHLPPQQIAENYRFKNLYDIWLKGDHYKWRAMRTNGVAEPCVPAMPRTARSLTHGRLPYRIRSAIRSITGRIWSCAARLGLRVSCCLRPPRMKSGISVTICWPRIASPLAVS